ncbi:unnamed protein product [Rotaria sp. Silwood2]|nr:unnamed protein product [Rotaria sp. Silwood2]CAF2908651.1 unnamed protein product [Rotaria sp. Silwood2]CAF3107309.1 unnamed protein product [Rotaria sp. Silwood2]CAF3317451.1 unnamed protein product [Rotaria sp. Silwood2]CAF4234648.1 unnamed protein product [Rotaria sp. Silwood2]
MFFFNGRIRNPNIIPIVVSDRSYTHKVGHSCIIAGCLSIIIGLSLIITGLISETKKTTLIGIGVISLGVGFFITTLVCFYGKLNICYHNWAYGQNVAPLNIQTPQQATASAISMGPYTESLSVTQKIQSRIPFASSTPMTMLSDLEINNVIIARSIKIDKTTMSTDNIT